MTDLISALVEWNFVIRQAGWIIPALIQVIFNRGTITRARVIEIFLLYNIGVGGMITATSIIFHTLFADQTAESIGWATGNPFQMEVGVASLAIGIVGFFDFWRTDFWLPYIISKSIFGWGAGLVHVADILEKREFFTRKCRSNPLCGFHLALHFNCTVYPVSQKSSRSYNYAKG